VIRLPKSKKDEETAIKTAMCHIKPAQARRTGKLIGGEICLIFAPDLNPALDRTEQVNKIRSSATSVYL
jgi:hypothetical protein